VASFFLSYACCGSSARLRLGKKRVGRSLLGQNRSRALSETGFLFVRWCTFWDARENMGLTRRLLRICLRTLPVRGSGWAVSVGTLDREAGSLVDLSFALAFERYGVCEVGHLPPVY
jgi:hypothetical protein